MATADRAECGAADAPVVTPHGYGIVWAYTLIAPPPRSRRPTSPYDRSGEQGHPSGSGDRRFESFLASQFPPGAPHYARTTG